MKKILILLLALSSLVQAAPPVEWRTDQEDKEGIEVPADVTMQENPEGALADIVRGLNLLPTDVRESVIDSVLPYKKNDIHSGNFLGNHFERERVNQDSFMRSIFPRNKILNIGLGTLGAVAVTSMLIEGGGKLVNSCSGSSHGYLNKVACWGKRGAIYSGGSALTLVTYPLLYSFVLKRIRCHNPLNRHLTAVQDILVSEDGNYFVSISEHKSLLWDSKTHKCLGKFSYRSEVEQRFMSISSPNRYKNLRVADGQVQFYDRGPNENVQALDVPHSDFTAATYTPDGKRIITGTSSGKIQIYKNRQLLKEAFDGKPTRRPEQRKRERRKKQLKWGLAAGALAGAAYVGSQWWSSRK